MTSLPFPQFIQDTHRNIHKSCQICQKPFTIFQREHQCKRCLRAICSTCGDYRQDVFKTVHQKKNCRVCKPCFDASTFLAQYVKINILKFGQMSQIGKKWMKKLSKRPSNHSLDNFKHEQFNRKQFEEMQKSYSYQLRQFIGILTQKMNNSNSNHMNNSNQMNNNRNDLYNTIKEVYMTVISAVPTQNSENALYLIVMLLCFCSPDKATILALYLINLKENMLEEKKFLNECLVMLPFKDDLVKLRPYINYRSKSSSFFFIGQIPIDATVQLLTRIIQKRYTQETLYIQVYIGNIIFIGIHRKHYIYRQIQQVYSFMILHVFTNKDVLIKGNHVFIQGNVLSFGYCDLIMLRFCKIEEIKYCSKYIKIVKSQSNSILHQQKNMKSQLNQHFTFDQSIYKKSQESNYMSYVKSNTEIRNRISNKITETNSESPLFSNQQSSNNKDFAVSPIKHQESPENTFKLIIKSNSSGVSSSDAIKQQGFKQKQQGFRQKQYNFRQKQQGFRQKQYNFRQKQQETFNNNLPQRQRRTSLLRLMKETQSKFIKQQTQKQQKILNKKQSKKSCEKVQKMKEIMKERHECFQCIELKNQIQTYKMKLISNISLSSQEKSKEIISSFNMELKKKDQQIRKYQEELFQVKKINSERQNTVNTLELSILDYQHQIFLLENKIKSIEGLLAEKGVKEGLLAEKGVNEIKVQLRTNMIKNDQMNEEELQINEILLKQLKQQKSKNNDLIVKIQDLSRLLMEQEQQQLKLSEEIFQLKHFEN